MFNIFLEFKRLPISGKLSKLILPFLGIGFIILCDYVLHLIVLGYIGFFSVLTLNDGYSKFYKTNIDIITFLCFPVKKSIIFFFFFIQKILSNCLFLVISFVIYIPINFFFSNNDFSFIIKQILILVLIYIIVSEISTFMVPLSRRKFHIQTISAIPLTIFMLILQPVADSIIKLPRFLIIETNYFSFILLLLFIVLIIGAISIFSFIKLYKKYPFENKEVVEKNNKLINWW